MSPFPGLPGLKRPVKYLEESVNEERKKAIANIENVYETTWQSSPIPLQTWVVQLSNQRAGVNRPSPADGDGPTCRSGGRWIAGASFRASNKLRTTSWPILAPQAIGPIG